MNIGLDLRLFGTEHGGIGRYCAELFPKILKLDSKNSYFLFVNERQLETTELNWVKPASNAKIVPTKFRHYSFGEQLGFLRQLNKYNLDLVHFPNFNFPIFYKRPFVVTIHDLVHHKTGGAKKSPFLPSPASKEVIAEAALNSKAIITVSESSKLDIVKLLNAAPEKVNVIYEAASLNDELNDAEAEKIRQNYLLNKPYFLFVGVLERKKNLVNLTRGFDYFLQKYKVNMDLVIVGKVDRHYPEIKHKAMDIKNHDRLVFTGAVDDRELVALYKGASAFVSASLHEGFGLPGVEALSFGLPLLVSDIPVFNEIYDDAGVYFNPLNPSDIGEKMHLLLRDGQFYKQAQDKSLRRADLFDWQTAAEATLNLYQQCLDDNMINDKMRK